MLFRSLFWRLDPVAAARLDGVATTARTKPFVARQAAFAALIADACGNDTVVLGTAFDDRHRPDTQAILGRMTNWLPVVLRYDAGRPFVDWLRDAHRRVFDTLAHGDLPFAAIDAKLRAAGLPAPETAITFMLSREQEDRRFAGLVIEDRRFHVATMPRGCLVYVDAKRPDNCQVRFNADRYDRAAMAGLMDRYVRLLEAAAQAPQAPIGELVQAAGALPMRWRMTRWVRRARRALRRPRTAEPITR